VKGTQMNQGGIFNSALGADFALAPTFTAAKPTPFVTGAGIQRFSYAPVSAGVGPGGIPWLYLGLGAGVLGLAAWYVLK
jgi:hypothetical protein